MRYFYLLLVLFVFQFCQTSSDNQVNDTNEFAFAFLTDIHLQPERNAAEGFMKAIDTLNNMDIDFVLTGGDLIMDALGQSYERADSLYKLYDSLIQYLNVPLYNTIGNHEYFGVYKNSGIEIDHPDYAEKMYEHKITKSYYSFDHKSVHFIVLDAIEISEERRYYGEIDSVQMDWLKQDLEQHKGSPVILSLHIPLYTIAMQVVDSPTTPLGPGDVVNNANEVRELLEQYNVKMVLQGHWHDLEDVYFNGIHYVTGGALSARWWTGPLRGMEEGFLLVKVKDENLTWEYIDFGWDATEIQN